MCGIAGIYKIKHCSEASNNTFLLEAMAEEIIHRGPDEGGIWINDDQTVGFAHRRLSIIDLSSGQQPMHTPDGQLSLVFNGEIFNYIELRQQLIAHGHSFQTESDTEVILYLYRQYGLDFVSYMNGQFAIALWDHQQRRLVLARDRVGICPLYYTKQQDQLIFASEIKAIRPALKQGLKINHAALDQIFTFWSTVSPATIFEGINEVQPGQMLVIENGQVNRHQYWDWQFDSNDYWHSSEQEQADQLHDLLIDATKIRLRADVPVGAYLSGGLDSSVLVAMIHHYGGVDLRTFSLNFDEAGFDEKSYQSQLIEHLNANHSHLLVKNEDISKHLADTIFHTESPILRTAPVPMGLLSGSVRHHGYKVVLTGEGADEVLGGYDIFKEAKVRQFWATNPNSSFRPLLLKKLYPYLNLPQSDQGTYLKQFFGEALDQPNHIAFSHLPRWTTTAKAKMFYSQDFSSSLNENALDTMVSSLPDTLNLMHPFNRAQYIESKSLMAGYLLNSQGDRMLSKNSVEGRFPFLDHRVIEFANKVHPKYKMKGLNEKNLLKKAMAKYLPKEIVYRHKQPYRAPDVKAVSGQLLDQGCRELLSEKAINENGFFDGKKIQFLLKKADSGRTLTTSESQALVGILSTQILCQQFI